MSLGSPWISMEFPRISYGFPSHVCPRISLVSLLIPMDVHVFLWQTNVECCEASAACCQADGDCCDPPHSPLTHHHHPIVGGKKILSERCCSSIADALAATSSRNRCVYSCCLPEDSAQFLLYRLQRKTITRLD